jgi:hypothetical protein
MCLSFCPVVEADFVLALALRSSKADKAAQDKLKSAMKLMVSVMAAGNATASSCAGA